MSEDNNNKDIEVVQGIGNLDISPVYENTTVAKPKMQDEKPKNIVVPPVKKVEKSVEKEDIDEDEEIDKSEELDELEEINDEDYDNYDEDLIDVEQDEQIEFEDVDLDDDIDESDTDNE